MLVKVGLIGELFFALVTVMVSKSLMGLYVPIKVLDLKVKILT